MNEPERIDAGDPPPGGLGQTVSTVLWAFLGIRKRSAHDRAAASIKPVHVIVTGIVATALFVTTLILIVRAVVK